jgi:hypothetical protein
MRAILMEHIVLLHTLLHNMEIGLIVVVMAS